MRIFSVDVADVDDGLVSSKYVRERSPARLGVLALDYVETGIVETIIAANVPR